MLPEVDTWVHFLVMLGDEWTGKVLLGPWMLKKAAALDTESITTLWSLQAFARSAIADKRERESPKTRQ